MITIQDLTKMLSLDTKLIHDLTNGLSQADTLIQPQPGGNCMNWVLGHLLDNQITLLSVLGCDSPVDPAGPKRYQHGSDPVTAEGPGVLPLERLLSRLDQVHAAIIARLAEMTETEFDREIQQGDRMVRLGSRVFFLYFHYTYHTGQLELLRSLAGKTEKVI